MMIKDLLLWLYWYPFRFIIQKTPPRYVFGLAKLSGLILYYISHRRRKALKSVFSDIFSEIIENGNVDKVLKESFVVLCQNEMDVMFFSELNRDNILDFVDCSGLENLDMALMNGKGAMLLFAHFGANQMVMPAVGYRGYKMSQLSAPATVWVDKLPNKKFSNMGISALKLRWEQELSLPVKHINIFGSMKEVFSCLKRNEVLGIAIDGGGGTTRIGIEFLGKKAFFSTGAMEIAMRTGCAVLPTFMIRDSDGKHKMIIEMPLNIQKEMDDGDVLERNFIAFVKKLEEYVLRYPSHYLNFLTLRRFMETQGDAPFLVNSTQQDGK